MRPLRPGPSVVVAGLGSEYRRDDGAGRLVAAGVCALRPGVGRLRCVGPLDEPLDLLGEWDGADLAVVADALRSGAPPGTVRLVELVDSPAGAPALSSTHGLGLGGALRLARALGRAPLRVVVVGIEGADFGRGRGLTPAVRDAIPEAVRAVADLIGTSPGVR